MVRVLFEGDPAGRAGGDGDAAIDAAARFADDSTAAPGSLAPPMNLPANAAIAVLSCCRRR